MSFVNKLKLFIMVLVLTGLVIATLSSCKTGYGCHGNQSFRHMVKRNNAP